MMALRIVVGTGSFGIFTRWVSERLVSALEQAG